MKHVLVSVLPEKTEDVLNQLREKEEEIAGLRQEMAGMRKERDLLERQYQNLKLRHENLKRQYDEVRLCYDTISNAFFWKITGPFRWILDRLKRILRGNRFAHMLWNALRWVWWRGNIPDSVLPKTDISETDSGQQAEQHLFYQKGDSMHILCTKHTRFIGQLIQNCLGTAGILSDILTEEPESYSREAYIVVCPQMFQNLPERYISFQMEQTVTSRWLNKEYMDRLEHSYAVFDYSLVNIAYFQRETDFSRMFYYLPVDYLPGIGRDAAEPAYDVLFYGDAANERRRNILEKLSGRFSVKLVSEVFGEELYKELCKAKVVVNIHYYENALLETTRLYETLSIGCSVIVSERSSDPGEEERLEGIVDFVPANDTDAMAERIQYWLIHEDERRAAVERNNELLSKRASAFDYYFYRFLLANDWISFEDFYRLAGDFVHFDTNHICLSLPESVERQRAFHEEMQGKKIRFELFPGLRHRRGWTGCGLSYKFIMKKAMEQGLDGILICEDDVLLPDDFDSRWNRCREYLNDRDDWDVFQGIMSDLGKVTIKSVHKEQGQTFVHMDHMISTVFNYYRKEIFERIAAWDETDDDVLTNTIDRSLELDTLRVVCTVPFLVGHKEELSSVIWGFKNTQYKSLIEDSSKKLSMMVKDFEQNKVCRREALCHQSDA